MTCRFFIHIVNSRAILFHFFRHTKSPFREILAKRAAFSRYTPRSHPYLYQFSQLFLQLLPVRQFCGNCRIKRRGVVRVEKVRKFMKHHILNTPGRRCQKPEIKGEHTPSGTTVPPLRNHFPKADLRKCHTFFCKHRIYRPAEIPHRLFAGILPPAVEHALSVGAVCRIMHQKQQFFSLCPDTRPAAPADFQMITPSQIEDALPAAIILGILLLFFPG